MADQDGSDQLFALLSNGTRQNSPHHTGIKKESISWLDDVETMLLPIKRNFAVFETVVFKGDVNSTVFFNQTFSIPNEGIFSTYFLFGPHHPLFKEEEDGGQSIEEDLDLGDLIDDIFGEDDPAKNPTRLLLPT